MRLISIAKLSICLGAMIVLAACAAASPGFVPPSEKVSTLSRMKPFEAGSVTPDGAYVPSAAEQALDCRKLSGSMQIIIARLKDSPRRPQPSLLATTAQKTRSSVTGSDGIDMSAEDRREKARLIAYNTLLADKKCQVFNLETELSAQPKNRS